MLQDDISPTKGRGYGHVTENFAVSRDAARRAGLSATAELLVHLADQTTVPLTCCK